MIVYIFLKGTDICVFNRCVKFSYGPCCWQFGDIKATLAALHQDGSTSGIALHYCTFHCIAHHITSYYTSYYTYYYMPCIIVHFIVSYYITLFQKHLHCFLNVIFWLIKVISQALKQYYKHITAHKISIWHNNRVFFGRDVMVYFLLQCSITQSHSNTITEEW